MERLPIEPRLVGDVIECPRDVIDRDDVGAAELRADLARFADAPPSVLSELLNPSEVEALRKRAGMVARLERFPNPDPDSRPYPWPLV